MILLPNFQKHPTYVMSVYYKDMIRNNQRVPISIPLELEGFIAHELSHMVKEFKKVPKTIQNVLKKRRVDFKSVQKEIILSAKKDKKDEDLALIEDDRIKANREAEIDMIASLLGFKDCIIAKLDFMEAYLERYKWENGPGLLTKEKALKQIRFRKREVLRYC